MKFVYVDESGDQGQSDVFVMAGLLVDAYRLRKHTAVFDEMIKAFLEKHPNAPKELKTKALINGSKKWSQVDPKERKEFVEDVCKLATECARIFAIAVSFEEFAKAAKAGHRQPFGNDYWLGAAMFLSSLVQKKVQRTANNKGLTVLIFDDNQAGMPKLSGGLYEADPWFDPIYQISKKNKGKTVWNEIPEGARFDHIINSAFAIKSHHSSLIQVADAVSYVYRRHLELKSEKESWAGEQKYFEELFGELQRKRVGLGRNPGGPCIEFYQAVTHKEWVL